MQYAIQFTLQQTRVQTKKLKNKCLGSFSKNSDEMIDHPGGIELLKRP